MPAYKVPCPRCGNFIMRDVAVCPFCRTADPFAPARCTNCRAVLEDPRWAVCPQCGTDVPKPGAPGPAGTASQAGQPTTGVESRPAPAPPPAPAPSPAPGAACAGCGAPLAAGARFCTVCGTIAG